MKKNQTKNLKYSREQNAFFPRKKTSGPVNLPPYHCMRTSLRRRRGRPKGVCAALLAFRVCCHGSSDAGKKKGQSPGQGLQDSMERVAVRWWILVSRWKKRAAKELLDSRKREAAAGAAAMTGKVAAMMTGKVAAAMTEVAAAAMTEVAAAAMTEVAAAAMAGGATAGAVEQTASGTQWAPNPAGEQRTGADFWQPSHVCS